uniref:Uncharacterized protein n=1 Tax=Rhizophora mucronata TaxID=61149 RepID=A0A2P2QKY3_RHIMU
MNSVVLMLNSHSVTLPVPSKPAYFMDSNIASDMSVSLQSKVERNEDSITELHPR